MNILVQLSHPAHFHLYKKSIINLGNDGHTVYVIIKTKDILEELLKKDRIKYYNVLPTSHRKTKLGILFDMFVREARMLWFCYKHKIDILTGSTPEVAHVSWLLNLKSVNTGEDDIAVVPSFVKVVRGSLQTLLSPTTCDNGIFNSKSIKYPSYHELAYLHPNHFTPDKKVVEQYFSTNNPYFILRFASLNAHHDTGINGINTEVAQKLIDILSPHGDIYITSERELEPQFEKYRIKINPLDMHHVLAFASIYIGDSQTMAAEAGVLGVPFVRFNDFVGRIGYLRELEDVYHLGCGIRANTQPFTPAKVDWIAEEPKTLPCGAEAMYSVVKELLSMDSEERRRIFQDRRQKMLSEKIDYTKFLTWFIENYPDSKKQVKDDADWWQQFK